MANGNISARARWQRMGRNERGATAIRERRPNKATFFGFLAADQLDQPYAICPLSLADDRATRAGPADQPRLAARVRAVCGRPARLARREWTRALQGADQATLRDRRRPRQPARLV